MGLFPLFSKLTVSSCYLPDPPCHGDSPEAPAGVEGHSREIIIHTGTVCFLAISLEALRWLLQRRRWLLMKAGGLQCWVVLNKFTHPHPGSVLTRFLMSCLFFTSS